MKWIQFALVVLFMSYNFGSQVLAQESRQYLRYGDKFHLQNNYGNCTGGYLDVRGAACEGNKLCVSTAASKSRDGGSGLWTIQSVSGKASGEPVLVSDQVYLLNNYSGNGGYLDVNGAGCEGNKLCVSTSTQKRRDGRSGIWTILSSRNTSQVKYNDAIYFRNEYYGNNLPTYLDVRGGGCDSNKLCVSTSIKLNRDGGSGTWRPIARELASSNVSSANSNRANEAAKHAAEQARLAARRQAAKLAPQFCPDDRFPSLR